MPVELLSADDVERQIKQRIKNGYVLLLGNTQAISAIEQDVYPPGTPKNGLFELFVMPVPAARPIFLAQKTEGLRERLNDPPDYGRTLAFIFSDETVDMGKGKGGCVVQQIYYPADGDLDRAVEQLFASDEGDRYA